MSRLGYSVDLLMEGEVEVQFLDQREGIKWRLEKIVGKRGDGHCLEDQIRIRREIAFRSQGLVEAAKMRLRLELKIKPRQ